MTRTRWLMALLLAAGLSAGEAVSVPRPLALAGTALEAVDHALITLAQGDTSAIEALPLEAFLDPVARPDATNDGVAHRWTRSLPAALARLDASARRHALTRLDARYHALAGERSGNERVRLASTFLPAPAAIIDLTAAADRAFDLGHFSDFLGLSHLLADHGPRNDARREQVALQLSGLGPEVDPTLRLPAPGTPLPSAGHAQVPDGYLAMRWVVVPGWVLACDPFGQVVWQYRVDRQAQVTRGPGAVLVLDSNGLRALNEDGVVTQLPPLPSGASVLTIAGGCAWFATGERAWRLALHERTLQTLALSAPPLGAPLVRGPQSLWLTDRELLLFDGDRLVHRLAHSLPATNGWRLGIDGERPVVLGVDGRLWRLESFTDQLARLSGIPRAALLLQAHRADEALVVLGEPNDDAGRRLGLRAHLSQGPQHIARLGDTLEHWCSTPQDRVLVALAQAWAADPRGQWFAAPSVASAPLTVIDRLTNDHPELRLSARPELLGDDPADWDHACSSAAWSAGRAHRSLPTLPANDTLVEEEPVDAPASNGLAPASVRRDGSLVIGDLVLRLERGMDSIQVTCHSVNRAWRWHQRWRPANFLSAPSQTIDVHDDHVVVSEGGLRLNVFALASGQRLGTFRTDDLSAGTPYPLTDRLALIGPLGVDTTLTLVDAHGTLQTSTLPSPARWALALGSEVLIAGQDAQARLLPSGRVISLPAALLRGRQAPSATADGLVRDGKLWRWER